MKEQRKERREEQRKERRKTRKEKRKQKKVKKVGNRPKTEHRPTKKLRSKRRR